MQPQSPFAPAHDAFSRLLNRLEPDPEWVERIRDPSRRTMVRARLDEILRKQDRGRRGAGHRVSSRSKNMPETSRSAMPLVTKRRK